MSTIRTIKFRGKNGVAWFKGDLEYCPKVGVACIHTYSKDGVYDRSYQVNPDTIGQFTGLLDINGKEIYEGDIVQRVYRMEEGRGKNKHEVLRPVGNCKPKVISFRMGAFGYVNFKERECVEEEWLPILDEECEVLGNIFDNPEIECGGD